MPQTRFEATDVHVDGSLSCKTFVPPASSITNAAILANTQVAADKVQQQGTGIWNAVQLFEPATAVAAVTRTLGMAYGSGTLVEFAAWIEVVATGGDRTVTVDLHKSTGGGAYATVLSATIGFTNGSTIRVKSTGTFSSTSYVAGDIFRATVAVAGAAGNQATGLTIRLTVRENSQ